MTDPASVQPSFCDAEDAEKIKEACKYDAVDLDMQAKTVDLAVGAIVWATGWEPYDAHRIDNLGFGVYPNIITNMMMERLAAPNGPTSGSILRPPLNNFMKLCQFRFILLLYLQYNWNSVSIQ